MTVKELKEELEKYDDKDEVYYYNNIEGYFIVEEVEEVSDGVILK